MVTNIDNEKAKLVDALTRVNIAYTRLKEQTEEYINFLKILLFEKYPIRAVTITGYTPYFNDGSACTFGANLEYPDIVFNGETLDDEYEGQIDETKEIPSKKEQETYYEEICELLSIIPEDILESLYNKHGFKLTMLKNKVIIEDFTQHD